MDFLCRTVVNFPVKHEPVGQCNGLICLMTAIELGCSNMGAVTVVNPTRSEKLVMLYSPPTGESGYNHSCHGFGFDPSTQKYKVVLIYTSKPMTSLFA